jgi:hypothetical protein
MTYAELQTKVVSFLNRIGFTELEAEVPFLMEMAQRRIARTCDLRAMEVIKTDVLSALTAPTGVFRVKTFTIEQSSQTFELSGVPYKKVKQAAGQTGIPKYYAVVGNVYQLGPVADSDYDAEIVTYQMLPLLTDLAPNNWLSDEAPELLLYATLIEAGLFLKDDARAGVWEKQYNDIKKAIEDSEMNLDKESGGLAVRSMG